MVVVELGVVKSMSTNDWGSLFDYSLELLYFLLLNFNFIFVFFKTEINHLLSCFAEFISVVVENFVKFYVLGIGTHEWFGSWQEVVILEDFKISNLFY